MLQYFLNILCEHVTLKDWLIEWIEFYAVSEIFQPCNGGTKRNHRAPHILTWSFWFGKWISAYFVCLFGVFRPIREFFTQLVRDHCRWRAVNFDQCSALMAIEQWRFFSVPHFCDTGHPFIMVIFEDPWHLHLMPSVWQ